MPKSVKQRKKAWMKAPARGSQQGTEDGDPEGGQVPVPHGLGDHQGLFVHIPHGVVDQQEGHRHRVDHIPHQQAAKAVDVKELVAQQPGDAGPACQRSR